MRFAIGQREFEFRNNTILCLNSRKESLQVAESILKEAKRLERPVPMTVGFVGEEFPLLANLSIIENALLPVLYHAIMSKKKAAERFDFLAERLQISEFRHARKNEVSEDVLFKASVLRAMMASPELIYIDFTGSEHSAIEFSGYYRDTFPEDSTVLLFAVLRPIPTEGFQEVFLND